MKNVVSLALTMILCLGLAVPALAAETPLTRAEFAKLLAPYAKDGGKGDLPADCAKLSDEERAAVSVVVGSGWMYGDEEGRFSPGETMSYSGVSTVLAKAADPEMTCSTTPVMPPPTADEAAWEEHRRLDQAWREQMEARFPNAPAWIRGSLEILESKGVSGVRTVQDWGADMDPETAALWVKTAFSDGEDLPGAQEETEAPAQFADVPADAYYAEAVRWAVEKQITSGTSKTTFSPNKTCSRAQILTFLWRAGGSPEAAEETAFTDLQAGAYYAQAAQWAAEKGLVTGTAFGGDADCTRAMTVEYLWKAAGSPAPSGKADFTDVPAGADYEQAVAWAVEQKITSGTGEGKFSPDATCTRGQIAAFLYRALGE